MNPPRSISIPNKAVSAPAGSLSTAIATGTPYGSRRSAHVAHGQRRGERSGGQSDDQIEWDVATCRADAAACRADDLDRSGWLRPRMSSVVIRAGVEAQRYCSWG